jgi:hypothetical protein
MADGECDVIQGQVENELLEYADEKAGKVEIYILRPAMILSKNWSLGWLVFGLAPSIGVDVLGQMKVMGNKEMNAWVSV